MKILFLDIDGVLNSLNYYQNRSDDDNRPYPLSEFDPKAIKMLNIILEDIDQLVLSSDWRHELGIKNILIAAGINTKKVNQMICTPIIGDRGKEISAILDKFRLQYDDIQYVILDDDPIKGHTNHIVYTSYNTGLTLKEAEEVKRILN